MSEKKATRVAYGEHLAKLGAENPKIVVLDALPQTPPNSKRSARSGFSTAASPRAT